MDFLQLKDIAERYLEIINPTSAEKILKVGQILGLKAGDRIIDFGCGYAEPLRLWAEEFGISAVGIDLREQACERAREKMEECGLEDRIEIVCGDAAEFEFEPRSFDAATCIGASFIWHGFRPSLQAMPEAVRPGGRMAIGEPYWRTSEVPAEYARSEPEIATEHELLRIIRDEGFDVEYVVRGSDDDWDRYESGNWRGLLAWLRENPDHPERGDVLEHLRETQDEYFRHQRRHLGWAIYVLHPAE